MSGPSVSGGGTIAVETAEMLRAAHRLTLAQEAIAGVTSRTALCVGGMAASERRSRAEAALVLLRRADGQAAAAADGLRIASARYGSVEHTILDGQRGIAAGLAALTGGTMRALVSQIGFGGMLLVAVTALDISAALVAIRILQRAIETGRFAPQADPVLLRALQLVLSSLDDGVRGALLTERPEDLLTDDPAAPYGVESTATLLAALFLHPAGAPLSVARTARREVTSPRSLASLVDRLPDGKEAAGQVRIERYEGADGPRSIVYIAGTVTFDRDSGAEPFDLASDVLGVAHRSSDSERAVLEAMRSAGIGPDEPVLLVGHSQGALNAVRVAQDGGYRVGGVVQFGGPTGQIALPDDVPVLSVEHNEDLVPVLGGTAASGAAGLRRVVVRRSLPDGGFGVATSPATADFPAHDQGAYRRTIAAAEASGDDRVLAFRSSIAPFLDGRQGTSTRWQARRVSPVPSPTAGAGPGPRPIR
ncbi:hypothetical protein [uncultured Amnibacterium sp.]|uniref:hypothetical protein n=1 Tax=uncultured Amnibacterium sp. TaxID=1631851 RepID=UPI0035CAA382